MKVVLVYDVRGWAFHCIAERIQHHANGDGVSFACLSRDEWKAVDINRYDAVHFFWWHDALVSMNRLKGMPFTVSFHGHVGILDTDLNQRSIVKVIERAQRIAAVNGAVADGIHQRFGRHCEVIHEGVDCHLFHKTELPSKETHVVGWAGNSLISGREDYKGVAIIQEAAKLAGWRFEAANRNVVWRQQADMPSWFSGIDVYACASVEEGNPKPVQEALACGRPFVSTAVGVVPRLLSDSLDLYGVKCGLTVERTAEDIANGLRWFAADPNRIAIAGAAGRGVMERRWRWEETARGYRSLILGQKSKKDISRTSAPRSVQKRCRVLYLACAKSWRGPRKADDLRAEAFSCGGKNEVRLVDTVESACAARSWADIAIFGSPISWVRAAEVDPRIIDLPHVVTLHGYSLPHISPTLGVHPRVMPFMRAIPWLTLTSNRMMASHKWQGSRVSMLPNPCPVIAKLAPNASRNAKKAGMAVGTFSSLKGGDRLIDWLRKYPSRRVKWAGAPGHGIWNDGRLLSKRKPDSLNLLGLLAGNQVEHEMMKCPWVIHLSRMESCPMAVLEALAMGRPVITSDAGDVREMIGDAGVIVRPDASSIERGVMMVEENLEELSRRARDRAQEMSIAILGGSFDELLNNVLDSWAVTKRSDASEIVHAFSTFWVDCPSDGLEELMFGRREIR